jgi:hypothetical protein
MERQNNHHSHHEEENDTIDAQLQQSLHLDEQFHNHENVPITKRIEQLRQSANFVNE